jgi:hypothetical protein
MISDVELIQIIFALGSNAYTGSITRAVRGKIGGDVQVGWLHMRLNRLRSLGLLKQEKGEIPEKGNRPKSFVRLTQKGLEIGQFQDGPGRASASLREAFD